MPTTTTTTSNVIRNLLLPNKKRRRRSRSPTGTGGEEEDHQQHGNIPSTVPPTVVKDGPRKDDKKRHMTDRRRDPASGTSPRLQHDNPRAASTTSCLQSMHQDPQGGTTAVAGRPTARRRRRNRFRRYYRNHRDDVGRVRPVMGGRGDGDDASSDRRGTTASSRHATSDVPPDHVPPFPDILRQLRRQVSSDVVLPFVLLGVCSFATVADWAQHRVQVDTLTRSPLLASILGRYQRREHAYRECIRIREHKYHELKDRFHRYHRSRQRLEQQQQRQDHPSPALVPQPQRWHPTSSHAHPTAASLGSHDPNMAGTNRPHQEKNETKRPTRDMERSRHRQEPNTNVKTDAPLVDRAVATNDPSRDQQQDESPESCIGNKRDEPDDEMEAAQDDSVGESGQLPNASMPTTIFFPTVDVTAKSSASRSEPLRGVAQQGNTSWTSVEHKPHGENDQTKDTPNDPPSSETSDRQGRQQKAISAPPPMEGPEDDAIAPRANGDAGATITVPPKRTSKQPFVDGQRKGKLSLSDKKPHVKTSAFHPIQQFQTSNRHDSNYIGANDRSRQQQIQRAGHGLDRPSKISRTRPPSHSESDDFFNDTQVTAGSEVLLSQMPAQKDQGRRVTASPHVLRTHQVTSKPTSNREEQPRPETTSGRRPKPASTRNWISNEPARRFVKADRQTPAELKPVPNPYAKPAAEKENPLQTPASRDPTQASDNGKTDRWRTASKRKPLEQERKSLAEKSLDDDSMFESSQEEEEDTPKEPVFKYQEVVRKKSEREALNGYECPECAKFVDEVMQGNGKYVFDRDELIRCSRHRGRHTPPQTPDGFWELSFVDEKYKR